MVTVIQLLIGALSCLVFISVARRVGLQREVLVYAVALIAAALIYVAFAAVGGAPLWWIALESGGLVLFSMAALLGIRGAYWALILGWAFHPAWDLLLHTFPNVKFVPEWYPVVCAGFDLFLAGYIAMRVREWRPGPSRLTSRSG